MDFLFLERFSVAGVYTRGPRISLNDFLVNEELSRFNVLSDYDFSIYPNTFECYPPT